MKRLKKCLVAAGIHILHKLLRNANLTNAELGVPSALNNFDAAMKRYSDVMERCLMTWDSDYLIRVVIEE